MIDVKIGRHLRNMPYHKSWINKIVSSLISYFHTFVIVFTVQTAQGVTKMFAVDVMVAKSPGSDQTPRRTRGV